MALTSVLPVRTVAVLALTGALVAAPTAVHARSVTHTDPRGDVAVAVAEVGDFSAAPDQVNGDVIKTRFRHKVKRIRIRVTFADLRRKGNVEYGVRAKVRTNEGVSREVQFLFWSGGAQVEMLSKAGLPISCRFHHEVNFRRNVAIVGFPRSCVGNPRWVRFGLEGDAWLNDEDETFCFDDALTNGPQKFISTSTTGRSPRIYRG